MTISTEIFKHVFWEIWSVELATTLTSYFFQKCTYDRINSDDRQPYLLLDVSTSLTVFEEARGKCNITYTSRRNLVLQTRDPQGFYAQIYRMGSSRGKSSLRPKGAAAPEIGNELPSDGQHHDAYTPNCVSMYSTPTTTNHHHHHLPVHHPHHPQHHQAGGVASTLPLGVSVGAGGGIIPTKPQGASNSNDDLYTTASSAGSPGSAVGAGNYHAGYAAAAAAATGTGWAAPPPPPPPTTNHHYNNYQGYYAHHQNPTTATAVAVAAAAAASQNPYMSPAPPPTMVLYHPPAVFTSTINQNQIHLHLSEDSLAQSQLGGGGLGVNPYKLEIGVMGSEDQNDQQRNNSADVVWRPY
uniref:Uncharacterized protein n=1 Tax=Trichogramma kaykai TaxID=54128 RepID=A0ABD2XKC7_9HYME